MVYARYSCSYTSTRASSCGNVRRDRLHVRSADCKTAAGSASGIHPTQPMHRRDTIHRDDVGGDAGIHLVLLRRSGDLVESAHHDALEAAVHGVLVPEVATAVLHPFEVADGHAAGVREDVGNDEDALLFEDLVRGGGGG